MVEQALNKEQKIMRLCIFLYFKSIAIYILKPPVFLFILYDDFCANIRVRAIKMSLKHE